MLFKEYVNSSSKLQDAIKKYFSLGHYDDKKVLRNVLLNRGWKPEEIKDYDRYLKCSNNISEDIVSPFQIINAILTRYILVLSKIDNENAKMVLDYIVIRSINKQLSNTSVPNTDIAYSSLVNEKINSVISHMEGAYMHNRFFEDQLENFLLSQFALLDVSYDTMKTAIDRIEYYPQYDINTLMPPPDGLRLLLPLFRGYIEDAK